MELTALEHLKNLFLHFFSAAIDPILFKLADNMDMKSILDKFDFPHDWTIDNRVAALEHLKYTPHKLKMGENGDYTCLLENNSKYFDDFTCGLSGERLLPFGRLVCDTDDSL